MNEEQTMQFLRELKLLRVCAAVSTTVLVLAFIAHILRVCI